MNRQRLEELRDLISTLPHKKPYTYEKGFNMKDYSSSEYNKETDAFESFTCKTAMCIAGWAITKYATEEQIDKFYLNFTNLGKELLDLDKFTAKYLFDPAWLSYEGYNIHSKDITPQQAVQAIQNVLDGCKSEHIWDHIL